MLRCNSQEYTLFMIGGTPARGDTCPTSPVVDDLRTLKRQGEFETAQKYYAAEPVANASASGVAHTEQFQADLPVDGADEHASLGRRANAAACAQRLVDL